MQQISDNHISTIASQPSRSTANGKIETNPEKIDSRGRSIFCPHYLRGFCTLSAQDCENAHGLRYLTFQKLDINNFELPPRSKGKTKPKEEEGDEEEEEIEEKPSGAGRKKPLGSGKPHKDLYEYQFVLKERGEVDTIHTIEEIDTTTTIRRPLRNRLHRDLQQEFMDFLYKEYNTKALNKAFIERCFLNVGWAPFFRHILNKVYAYEIKPQKGGVMVVKQLQGKDFDEYMEQCVIKIIKEKQLLDNAPISPSLISKLYFQLLGALDPYMPSYQIYLRYRDIKSLDDYLDSLQTNENFLGKLAEACGKTMEELALIPLFDHSNNEMQELMVQIKTTLLKTVEKSKTGFISYSKYEERVMGECTKRIQQFNNRIPQIKKLMLKMALEENVLVVNLNSYMYLLSLDKFRETKIEEVRERCYKKLYSGCLLPPSDHIALHQLPNLRPEKMNAHISDRKSEEFLEKEIDIRKVVVVDNEESLKEAIEHFATVEAIGVDLEGALRKNGRLELVQCGSRTRVFVFDVYKTKKLAQEDEKNVEVYKKISSFLKKLMEDTRICKIFHDGRKDSLALHIFLDACSTNVFDLSAVFLLIEHLDAFKAQKVKDIKEGKKQELEIEETKKDYSNKEEHKKNEISPKAVWSLIGDLKLPGLNDVLEEYKATHGPNRLKDTMKGRFGVVPREYFLKRPIDREFLIYSARDVEDLVEVKEKMEMRLRELLMFLLEKPIEQDKVDLLCKKVSKSFAAHGCENIDQE